MNKTCPTLKEIVIMHVKDSINYVLTTLTIPFVYIFKLIAKIIGYCYSLLLGVQTAWYAFTTKATTLFEFFSITVQTALGHARIVTIPSFGTSKL